LAVSDADFAGHVFLEDLDAGQIGGETTPQVPGAEVDHKMKGAVTDAGVDHAEALRVLQLDRLAPPDGHEGLVSVVPVPAVHLDDFGDLLLDIFTVGVVFVRPPGPGHQVR
jgi:hypothetical protein